MISLVYLSDGEDSPVAPALQSAGFKIYEAATVVEAHFLALYENVPAVIIDSSFEDPDLSELKRLVTTIGLKSGATPEDVIWQLSGLLSPAASSAVH